MTAEPEVPDLIQALIALLIGAGIEQPEGINQVRDMMAETWPLMEFTRLLYAPSPSPSLH